MSVIKSKRGESKMEFVNTARKLQIAIMSRLINAIPKRYNFYFGVPIANLASDIYTDVQRANAINPSNKLEANARKTYLIKAYSNCHALNAMIEMAYEVLKFQKNDLAVWSEPIAEEIRLLQGVMKADAKRFNFDS